MSSYQRESRMLVELRWEVFNSALEFREGLPEEVMSEPSWSRSKSWPHEGNMVAGGGAPKRKSMLCWGNCNRFRVARTQCKGKNMRHEAGEIDRSHILCSFENSTIEFKINIMGTKQLLSIITTISWGMREKSAPWLLLDFFLDSWIDGCDISQYKEFRRFSSEYVGTPPIFPLPCIS